MPSFRPMRPINVWIAISSLQLDLDVDAGGEVELAERVDRLLRRLEDVEQTLVGADLELLARLLVDVRGAVHGEAFDVGRQRNGSGDASARPAYGFHDLAYRLIEQPVVVRFQTDADLLVHVTFTRRSIRRSWSPHRRQPCVPLHEWRTGAPRPSRWE